jgi:gliding motility-associated-like protein
MKKQLLLITGILLNCLSLSAQDVVINKVYNSSAASPLGANDVIELLVIKDKLDMRGMYIKDVTSAVAGSKIFTDGGAKFMFADNPVWSSVRSGTTIVIRREPLAAGYVEDADPSDRKLDLKLLANNFFTAVRSASAGLGTFALGSYELVVIKAANAGGAANGAADGFNNLIHAFLAIVTPEIKNAFEALTGPDGTTASSKKIGGTEIIPGNGFLYPTNPTGTLEDYNGTSTSTKVLVGSSTDEAAYGVGEPGKNADFITYLRNAPVVESTSSSSAPGATTVVFVVKFSKPVTGVDASDFSLAFTGTATGTISAISGSGDTYNVTASGVSGEGLMKLNKVANGTGITDGTYAILEGFEFTEGTAYIVGKVPPEVVAGQVLAVKTTAVNGDLVGKVTATLNGTGAVDGWAIVAGNDNNEFAIDASGNVTVANSAAFDYAMMPTYTIKVTASNGPPRISEPVDVMIVLLPAPTAPEVVGAYNGIIPTLSPTIQGNLIAANSTIADYTPYKVTLYVDGAVMVSDLPVSDAGVWSYKMQTPLTRDVHTFYVTATLNGVLSDNSPAVSVRTIESGWVVTPNNIITPNGDGKNDTWKIANIELYPANEVKVFNKTGEVVYSGTNYQQNWDGSYNGGYLNPGTYYYQIVLGPEMKPLKGYLTLVKNK